jgi:hypothetical protein
VRKEEQQIVGNEDNKNELNVVGEASSKEGGVKDVKPTIGKLATKLDQYSKYQQHQLAVGNKVS